jgi:chromosome segregation ATPase
MNDTLLTYDLRRMADYNVSISEQERALLRSAAAAIKGTDAVLDESVPHLNSLAHLLEVVADAKKVARVVAQLEALTNEANAARRAAAQAASELDAKAAAVEPALASAKDEQERVLAAELASFESRCTEFQRKLAAREAAVADREKAVQIAADEVTQLRAQVETRLAAIRAAAA